MNSSSSAPSGGSTEGQHELTLDGRWAGEIGPGQSDELVAERSQAVLARLLGGQRCAPVGVGILHQPVELDDDLLAFQEEVDAADKPAVVVADLLLWRRPEANGIEQQPGS